jgi:general secretion pathway protein A
MYNQYFGLTETPFSIAPDPRYLYMSDQHREAFAHLLYGVNSEGGFVLLTGEVGTGKTTVCRCLLEQLPDNCDVAIILNPLLTVEELLSTICDEFGVSYPEGTSSIKVFVDLINEYLLKAHASGRKAVLIIDEAQNLSPRVLEQMRLLTNLETHQRKLLQIIMIGQPELRELLAKPELRQLAQRIVARFHLGPLTKPEVNAYVKHRLSVAGLRGQLFPSGTLTRLYQLSGGIPRLINILCDRALLGTYVSGKDFVDKKTLDKAAGEVFGKDGVPQQKRANGALVASLVLVCSVILVVALYYNRYIPRPVLTGGPAAVQEENTLSALYKKPVPVLDSLDKVQEKPEAANPEENPPQPETIAAVSNKDSQVARVEEKPPQDPAPPENAQQVTPGSMQWVWEQPSARSDESAFEVLLVQWGATYQQGTAKACQQAETQGLRCLSGQGGLDELRKLNRPAVLKLFNEQGRDFYVTLLSLHDQTAIFAIGTESRSISLGEMAPWWQGDYTLMWRTPPSYQRYLQVGDRGPAVDWLRSQLARLNGKENELQENVAFDNSLLEEVKRFQVANGLRPDGMAGPHTLIRLDTQLEGQVPLLVDKKKDS